MTNENYLKVGLSEIGLEIDNYKTDQFMSYLELLKKWGKSISLTTILDDKEIILKHFIDSLTVSDLINSNSSVLDIGSGAGFPGIPLLIFDETLSVALIEAVQKKSTFLNELRRKLGLDQLKVFCMRAENYNTELSGSFDYVIFRAVGKIEYLLSISRPYLKKGGIVIIMKSERGFEEIKKGITDDFSHENIHELNLPFTRDKRLILTYKLN